MKADQCSQSSVFDISILIEDVNVQLHASSRPPSFREMNGGMRRDDESIVQMHVRGGHLGFSLSLSVSIPCFEKSETGLYTPMPASTEEVKCDHDRRCLSIASTFVKLAQ